ncbi:MAG: hypothetical protein JWM85_3617 [Acidimicrobiaceae bacterium]|nr:hypothetical protein [Acidimicrobiaceae bacterium]
MQVILHTEANPEDNAMLQALYSRSPKSVTDHLTKLSQVGSGKFMEQFYLGYGHASIADCGFVTLYFEGISMLAAKAIEDNPLFNGQECSSRYIDFSDQPFVNPYPAGTDEHGRANRALEACRTFYVRNMDPVLDDLERRYPRAPEVAEIPYYKALKAKAFDILRGFLPAGATTNVSWTTSLRKAHERLVSLMHHPLAEVQELATKAYATLYESYPHSFKKEYAEATSEPNLTAFLTQLEGEEAFGYQSELTHFYATLACVTEPKSIEINEPSLLKVATLGQPLDSSQEGIERPYKEVLTRHSGIAQSVLKIGLTIDFGSFRDIQRHRGGYCSNPMLTTSNGFHSWYYENLPDESKAAANALFKELSAASTCVETPQSQYLVPMGCLVPVTLVYPVAQAVYVSELRSGKTVHPTLRPVAQQMAVFLKRQGIAVYADMDESDWTIRRGTQDIVPK